MEMQTHASNALLVSEWSTKGAAGASICIVRTVAKVSPTANTAWMGMESSTIIAWNVLTNIVAIVMEI